MSHHHKPRRGDRAGPNHSPNALTFCFCLLTLFHAGCQPDETPKPNEEQVTSASKPTTLWFRTAPKNTGIDFRHHSGHENEYLFPEIMSGGVACIDYNNDGWWDLYFIQGGKLKNQADQTETNRLFRNQGDGTFEDVTTEAKVGDPSYGMGAVVGDYDNDGQADIYVTNVGANVLYRNLGNGTFEDVSTKAGVNHPGWGTSASFLDFDQDNDLDLIVANYIRWSIEEETICYSRGGKQDYCSPLSYKTPAMDVLYRNNGDGTFTDITSSSGINQSFGNGLGVACADFDQNGWVDIFVANDALPNQLWLNQKNGTFKNEALIRGCAVNGMGLNEAGMGVGLADINQDGWWDLFVTHLESESNTLYLNTDGFFRDEVKQNGPGVMSWPFTGFGVVFADFDNDSILDSYIANGRVKYGPKTYDPANQFAEPNHLLKGIGDGAFEDYSTAIASDEPFPRASRASIQVDLNNDGNLDLVTVNRDQAAEILINQNPHPNSNWIRFRLLNSSGSDSIGAKATIETEALQITRLVQTGLGYCSSQDPRMHVGLGSEKRVEKLTVTWPNSTTNTYGPFEPNQQHTIQMP
jgi:hypothetical protein